MEHRAKGLKVGVHTLELGVKVVNDGRCTLSNSGDNTDSPSNENQPKGDELILYPNNLTSQHKLNILKTK